MFGSKKHKKTETIGTDFPLNTTEEDHEESLRTELSIPENWKMTEEEKYVFAFYNRQAPKLKKNQLSIYGMELNLHNDGSIQVTGLIRSTVSKSVQFKETVILLLNNKHDIIARKTFNLTPIGKLPTNCSRPWTFTFRAEDIKTNVELPSNDWSLAFELKRKHLLDLENSWEKSIAEETKERLEKIVKEAPKLKPGEVNFMGLQAMFNENDDLAVTVLIRNGADRNINLEQIPIGIQDANEEEIARGSFKLADLTVKANTSKPWTFIFPSSMVTKSNVDLSTWKAYAIQ